MSYLSIPQEYWPLRCHAYFHVNSKLRHQYTCLFHAVTKHPKQAFLLQGCKVHGLSYVLSGRAEVRYADGSSYSLEPGCFFYLDPQLFVSLQVDPQQTWRECSVAMHPDSAAPLIACSLLRTEVLTKNIGLQMSVIEAYKACMHLFSAQDDVEPGTACAAIVACLDAIYTRLDQQTAQSQWINQAKNVLRQNLSQRPSMEAIAAQLDMNYHAFRRKFKNAMGCAPGEWLIQQRIVHAQELLQKQDVETVAETLGYPDRFVFSKQFKLIVGYAPKQYQREVLRIS